MKAEDMKLTLENRIKRFNELRDPTKLERETFEEAHRFLKIMKHYDKRIESLKSCLQRVAVIMEKPASNRFYMQIAGPARTVLNIIKGVETL